MYVRVGVCGVSRVGIGVYMCEWWMDMGVYKRVGGCVVSGFRGVYVCTRICVGWIQGVFVSV